MSWTWEYAFGAEEAARNAPPEFLTEVERKAAEVVRAAEPCTYTDEAMTGMTRRAETSSSPAGCSRTRRSCAANASTPCSSLTWAGEQPSAVITPAR